MRRKGQKHWFSSNSPSPTPEIPLSDYLLFYFLPFHTLSPLIFPHCHLVCSVFAYLLIWHSHCQTIPPPSSVVLMLFVVFICRFSSPSVPPLSLNSYISFTIPPSFINSSSLSSLPLSHLSLALCLCHCASCVMSQGLISSGQPLSRWQPEQQLPGGREGGW